MTHDAALDPSRAEPTDPASPAPGRTDRTPRSRPRRVLRAFATVVAWLLVLVAVAGLLVRLPDTSSQAVVLLAAGAWVLGLAIVPALLLFILTRRWWSLIAVVAVVSAQVVAYAPLFVAETTPAGTRVTLMTQNAKYGRADAGAIVAAVRAHDVDVLFVQELTKSARGRLGAAGLDGALPFSRVAAKGGVNGLGIWSRFPLQDARRLPPQLPGGMTGAITLPDGQTVSLTSLHLAAPWPKDPDGWYTTLGQTSTVLAQAGDGPALVAGDFNSTTDQVRFRSLLTDGWRDAAEQAGAGIPRSWPAGEGVPPLIGIDHVLTHDAVATEVNTVDVPGSDHRGLVVTSVVPRA